MDFGLKQFQNLLRKISINFTKIFVGPETLSPLYLHSLDYRPVRGPDC